MTTLLHDLRFSLRTLGRSRMFTCLVVAILTLGIGAVTALFSVYDAVLLRPLPYANSRQLVNIDSTRVGRTVGTASWLEFQEWRRQSTSFSALGGYTQSEMNMAQQAHPERVPVTMVTANMFQILGVQTALGRFFTAGEDGPGAAKTVVLSYALWIQQFAGRADVLGQTIKLDEQPYTIIGVAPPDFELPIRFATVAWIPFDPTTDMFTTRGMHFINTIGQLKPGVSVQQASQDMERVAAYMRENFPRDSRMRGVALQKLSDAWTASYRTQLKLLSGAVLLLLLIACTNVANLLLARGSARSYETMIRIAVGASPARLLQLFLTESMVLAVAGSIFGTALGWGLIKVMKSSLHNYLADQQIGFLNWHMYVLIAVTIVVSAAIFGVLPAWHTIRNGTAVLRDSGLGKIRPRERMLRNGLVISEVAISVMLLAGAGLLVRTMWKLQHLPLGLDVERVLSLKVAPAQTARSQNGDATRFYTGLLEKLREVPGIQSAGIINNLPLSGPGMNTAFLIPGHPGQSTDVKPEAEVRIISEGYRNAMGITLLRGREFTESDDLSARLVAIINEAAAKKHFPGEDPMGRQIQLDEASPPLTVVGIFGSARQRGVMEESRPEIDLPYTQVPSDNLIYQLSLQKEMSLVVRSSLPAADVLARVRAAVAPIDSGAPVYEVQSMKEVMQHSLRGQEFAMRVLIFFGMTALLLAAAGVYGITAYLVARRTHEIGIRMALGATRGNILAMVMRHSMILTGVGVGVGLAGFLVLGKALSAFLYDISYMDTTTLGVTVLTLAFVGIFTSCVPAYRAMTIHPTSALRES